MTDGRQGSGLLSRWSRRKAAVRAGQPVEEIDEAPRSDALPATVEPVGDDVPGPAVVEPAEQAAEPAERAAGPAEDEAAPLPELAELDGNSDYSAFLAEKVPAAVRRQALRQLFSAAKFNIVDGLDDYDDDFRQILPLGDIVTSDMKHRAEVEARKAEQRAQEQARKAALGEDAEAGQALEEGQALEAEQGSPAALESEDAGRDELAGDTGSDSPPDADAPDAPDAREDGVARGEPDDTRASEPAVHRGLRRRSGRADGPGLDDTTDSHQAIRTTAHGAAPNDGDKP